MESTPNSHKFVQVLDVCGTSFFRYILLFGTHIFLFHKIIKLTQAGSFFSHALLARTIFFQTRKFALFWALSRNSKLAGNNSPGLQITPTYMHHSSGRYKSWIQYVDMIYACCSVHVRIMCKCMHAVCTPIVKVCTKKKFGPWIRFVAISKASMFIHPLLRYTYINTLKED